MDRVTVENTEEVRRRLREEMVRTNIGTERFFRFAANVPANLNSNALSNWLAGNVRHIPKGLLDYVFQQYGSFPTANVPITAQMGKELKAELRRVGNITPGMLADHPDKPFDLMVPAIAGILAEKVNRVYEHHWAFILERLKSLPEGPTVPFGDQERELLQFHRKRTRLGARRLAGIVKNHSERNYKTTYIAELLEGKRRVVSESLWQEIVSVLSSLPDAPRTTAKSIGMQGPGLRRGYILITDQRLQELRDEIVRTNASIRILVKDHATLSPVRVNRWKTGRTVSAPEDEWNYVLSRLRALPDTNESGTEKQKGKYLGRYGDRVPITQNDVQTISAHRDRTGVGFSALLQSEETPKGLRVHTISQWVSRTTRSANLSYLEWVKQEYASLPDKEDI